MLCNSCGRTLEPTAQFCGECGAQVGAIAGTPLDGGPATAPVTTPDLPIAPPLAPAPPSVPPPPPGVPTYAGVAPAGGPPDGGSSQRWALWLLGALAVLIVAFLASVAYYVLLRDDGGDDAASPPATNAAPPVTSAPTTTAEPTDDTEPSDDTTPTTAPESTDGGGAVTVEAYCQTAEELGALLQEAIEDPFSADPAEITALSTQLSEQAAAVTASATPEDLERINECTEALNLAP